MMTVPIPVNPRAKTHLAASACAVQAVAAQVVISVMVEAERLVVGRLAEGQPSEVALEVRRQVMRSVAIPAATPAATREVGTIVDLRRSFATPVRIVTSTIARLERKIVGVNRAWVNACRPVRVRVTALKLTDSRFVLTGSVRRRTRR